MADKTKKSKRTKDIRLNFAGFVLVNGEPGSEVSLFGTQAEEIYHTLTQSPNRKYFAQNCKCLEIKEVIYSQRANGVQGMKEYAHVRFNYREMGKHVPPRTIRRRVEDIV